MANPTLLCGGLGRMVFSMITAKPKTKLNAGLQPLVDRYKPPGETNNIQEYTICVDATFYDDTHSYATGFVIYDPSDSLRGVGFRKINPPGSVLAADVQAIYNGMSYGNEHFRGRKRILSDSLKAIHSIHNKDKYKGTEEFYI